MATTSVEPQLFSDRAQAGELSGRQRGLWSDAFRRLRQNQLAMAALILLILVTFVAFVGPYLPLIGRYGLTESNYDAKQTGPSWDHWFGTDQLSRDIFTRVLGGIRVSLQIGVATQIVALTIGLAVGASAALGGKFSDNVLMRLTDITFAYPDLLFIILLQAVLVDTEIPILTNQKVVIVLAIALVTWTTVARLVRGQMLSLLERDFVLAAKACGASQKRVVFTHMLPNTLGPVIVAVTFGIPIAIFAEAALGFVGLGIQPPEVSLGSLVSSGYAVIQLNVWNVVFPAAAVAMLMLCFTFIGDGLRDALDPRTR